MTRRHKIEVLVAILILIGLIVVLWLIFRGGDDEQVREEEVVTLEELEITDENGEVIIIEDLPVEASTVARVFVERFGSFSSENGYTNIDEVLSLATESLQSDLASLAADARSEGSDSYYGISTRVLSVSTVSSTDTTQIMSVVTQREESIDSPANTSVRYQTIALTLVADGDSWLVDAFAWE